MELGLAYLLGLWKADKCSTAKGIVGIRSKDQKLLDKTKKILISTGLPETKFRKREIKTGFSPTKEVYVCSLPLRRMFEKVIPNRTKIFSNKTKETAAFLAGFFDGDGSADYKRSLLYYCYGLQSVAEAEDDRKLIENLGFKTSIGKSGKAIKLRILKPAQFAGFILPHVQLERKRESLVELIRKAG